MSDSSGKPGPDPEDESPAGLDFERIQADLKALNTAVRFQLSLLQDLEEALRLKPTPDQA